MTETTDERSVLMRRLAALYDLGHSVMCTTAPKHKPKSAPQVDTHFDLTHCHLKLMQFCINGGSRHEYHFYRDKRNFVATKVLSRQAYFCRNSRQWYFWAFVRSQNVWQSSRWLRKHNQSAFALLELRNLSRARGQSALPSISARYTNDVFPVCRSSKILNRCAWMAWCSFFFIFFYFLFS